MSDATFFSMAMPLDAVVPSQDGKWQQALPQGEVTTDDGRPLRVFGEDLEKLFTKATRRKSKLPVLYEHGKGPRGGKAAGWIDGYKVENGFWTLMSFLDQAKSEILSGEWKYLSPGFLAKMDDDGYIRPISLVEVSLTNTPAIDGMKPVEASLMVDTMEDDRMGPDDIADVSVDTNDSATTTTSDESSSVSTMTTDAAIVATAAAVTPTTVTYYSTFLDEASIKAKVDELVELRVSERISQIENARKAETLVEKAIGDRKITKAQYESAMSLALADIGAFEAFVSKAVPVASSGRVVATGGSDNDVDNAADTLVKRAKQYQIEHKVSFRDAVVAVSK